VSNKFKEADTPLIGAMCWMLAVDEAFPKPGDHDAYTMFRPKDGVEWPEELKRLKQLCKDVNKPLTT
jgi:hypothetical protein